MDKPELLVTGVLPDWDPEPLAERCTLRLLDQTADPEPFVARHSPGAFSGGLPLPTAVR